MAAQHFFAIQVTLFKKYDQYCWHGRGRNGHTDRRSETPCRMKLYRSYSQYFSALRLPNATLRKCVFQP